ncbi:MAG: DUF5683 domain-containing protein, partial [Candidatus Krumholzibacteria bacterium]|nr:DUF5683 domain-containing protein [Candidatus Krumholzibacteria bacterium]
RTGRFSPIRPVTGQKGLFRACVISLLWLAVPAHACAKDAAFVRSLLLPGAGQAHQGHYTKAAVFAGVAIISTAGLFASQIHYKQAVDRLDNAKGIQTDIQLRLTGGEIVSIDEITGNYSEMQQAHDQADTRLGWRNTFLAALISTYAINLVDVWFSQPHDTETALRYRIEMDQERVLLTRSFRF